jgi:hypothetical protein
MIRSAKNMIRSAKEKSKYMKQVCVYLKYQHKYDDISKHSSKSTYAAGMSNAPAAVHGKHDSKSETKTKR